MYVELVPGELNIILATQAFNSSVHTSTQLPIQAEVAQYGCECVLCGAVLRSYDTHSIQVKLTGISLVLSVVLQV